jgi:hypothetical protein
MKKIIILLFLCSFTWTQAQTVEIKFDVNNAGGWFGGDARPAQIRNVAVAQSVFIEFPITLQSFAFYFASPFDFILNPTDTGHDVSLRMHIRDSIGVVLDSVEVTVADTFSGGWIKWSNIDFELNEPAKFIFSTYLIGGYDSIKVHSS